MLKTNEQALKARYKGLYEKIEQCSNDNDKIEIKDGKLFYKEEEIDKDRIIKEDIKSFDLIILYGFGRANTIKLLKDKFKKTTLVVMEPNLCLLKKVFEWQDFSDIIKDPSIFIIVPDMNNLEKDIGNLISVFNMKLTWGTLYRYTVWDSKNDDMEKIGKITDKYVLPIILNRNTLIKSSQRIAKNAIRNIPSFVKGGFMGKITGLFKNKPAVVVASGPSLSKNIEILKEIQDKVIVIAVDSVISSLIEHGIKADIVCGVDYQEINMQKYSSVQKFRKKYDSLYIHADGVYHGIPKLFMRTLSDYTENAFSGLYKSIVGEKRFKDFSVNAVTHLAIKSAYIMGANPIVFIGQDWAYSGGMEHAKNTSIDFSLPKNVIWVKGNYEEKVPTTPTLYSGLKLVEDIINILKDENIQFINATEGGAYINNTVIASLKETAQKYATKKLEKSALNREFEKNYEAFINKTESISKHLSEIIKDSTKAIKMDKEVLKKWKQTHKESEIANTVDKINSINNRITEDIIFYSTVSSFFFKEFFYFNQEEIDIEGQSVEQRINQSLKYFELIKDKTSKAKKYVDELLDYLTLEKALEDKRDKFLSNLDNVIKLLSIYFEFGDIYGGLELVDKALQTHTDNALLYYWKAKLCTLNRFMYKDSLEYFKKAVEYDPNFKKAKFDYEVQKKIIQSHLILAKKEVTRQNFIAAKNLVKRALEHDPDNEDAKRWYSIIEEMASVQKSKERQKLLFEQLKMSSDAFEEYERIMEFVRNEELDKAYEKLLYLYEKYGAFGDIPFLLGSIMMDRKDFEKTEEYLKEAVELIPFQPLVYVALGKLYLLKEDYFNAKESLEKALSMNEKLIPEISDALGNLYYEFGEYEKAISTFQEYLPYSEDKKKTILKIALCYKEVGMIEEYNALMDKIRQLDKAN